MGWTTSGKYVFVAYERSDDAGLTVIDPVTAYEIDPPLNRPDGLVQAEDSRPGANKSREKRRWLKARRSIS